MTKTILIIILIILTIIILFFNSLKIKIEYFITVDESKYPNMVYQKDTNLLFLNIPPKIGNKNVDRATGIFRATQIKYDCDANGENCKFDLIYE